MRRKLTLPPSHRRGALLALLGLALSAGAQPQGRSYTTKSGLVMRLPAEWVLASEGQRSLELSRDGPNLHHVQLQWGQATPPPSLPAVLDAGQRRLAHSYPKRHFELKTAATIDDGHRWGVQAVFMDRDTLGLRWGTRVYWLYLAPNHYVQIFHRAPWLHYFQRDAEAVQSLAASIRKMRP